MSSLRRSPRIAAASVPERAAEPEATRSGRISTAPKRFEDERFRELPMANNKYTKGRKISPGFSIEHESTPKYGSTDQETLDFIKESVKSLKDASVDDALELLDDMMEDLNTIVESAPDNEDLNDALCLFYNAYDYAEEASERRDPERLLRKAYKEARMGYQLLVENVRV
jgi:hypothetical protein